MPSLWDSIKAVLPFASGVILSVLAYFLGKRQDLRQNERKANIESDGKRLDALSKYEEMLSKYGDLKAEFAGMTAKMTILENKVQVQEDEIKALRIRSRDCEKVESENVSLRERLRQKDDRLQLAEIELSAALRAQEKAEGAYVAAERLLRDAQPSIGIETLRRQVDENRHWIERAQQREAAEDQNIVE